MSYSREGPEGELVLWLMAARVRVLLRLHVDGGPPAHRSW